ncbi:MAG: hypothetical protein ACKESB_02520 [Candidatus Hodgkinia cicadicola]
MLALTFRQERKKKSVLGTATTGGEEVGGCWWEMSGVCVARSVLSLSGVVGRSGVRCCKA